MARRATLAVLAALGAVPACSLAVSLDGLSTGEGSQSSSATTGSTGGVGQGGEAQSSGATQGGAGGGAAQGTGGGGQGGGPILDPPWWDTAYPTRYRLEITNVAGDDLPAGFQVGVGIDVESLQENGLPFAGVRVVRWDEGSSTWTELPRVIDDVAGGGELLWLALEQSIPPAESVTDCWIYSGNPSPPAAPNDPALVFELWEGFDGALDPNVWAQNGGVDVSGGDLVVDAPVSGVRTTSDTFSHGFAVDFALEIGTDSDYFWGGFQRVGDFDETDPWLLWCSRDTSAIRPDATLLPVGVSFAAGAPVTKDGSRHIYGVERYPEHAVFVYDGVVHDEIAWSGTFSPPMQLKLYAGGGAMQPLQLLFDFVRVRRASDPPPLVQIGPAETYP